jgi:hypothetical protein
LYHVARVFTRQRLGIIGLNRNRVSLRENAFLIKTRQETRFLIPFMSILIFPSGETLTLLVIPNRYAMKS